MEFQKTNYLFRQVRRCLIDESKDDLSYTDHNTSLDLFEQIIDRTWSCIVSHQVSYDTMYKDFVSEVENNFHNLSSQDFRAVRMAEVLKDKLADLIADYDFMINDISQLWNQSKEEIANGIQGLDPEFFIDEIKVGERINKPVATDYSQLIVSVITQIQTFCNDYINLYLPDQRRKSTIHGIMLQWNGTSDSLYDLFAQLSLTNTSATKPLIGNTVEGLARFLAEHVENMPSIATIERRLRAFREPTAQPPTRGRIELHINKDKT